MVNRWAKPPNPKNSLHSHGDAWVEFRKSHDGLLGEGYHMGLDPFAGDVVLFVGRCKRLMKLLFADDSGLWLAFKRFNSQTMKSKFKFLADPSVNKISTAELQMFFEGNAYRCPRAGDVRTKAFGYYKSAGAIFKYLDLRSTVNK